MLKKKGMLSAKLLGGFVLGTVLVLTLFFNLNNGVTMTSQTYQTPSGTVQSTSFSCQQIPIIGNNPFCQYSTTPAPSVSNVITKPVTITPQKNQTITVSSPSNSVSITPTNNQPITIQAQNGGTITGTTSSGQTVTSSTITVTTPISVSSNSTINVVTTTSDPVTIAPSSGGSATITSPTLPNTLSLSDCPNGGTSLNGVCPTSVTNVPPICSEAQIKSGYTISGNQCVSPPPVCSSDLIAQGYSAQGNVCTPPPQEQVSIIPVANLYDNNGGNTTLSSSTLPFFLGSFIAQQNQNVNVDHGKITFVIKLQGKPNTLYQATGTLKVYLNGASLHPQGIPFAINQATDNNGQTVANLQIGNIVSNQYVFDIAQRASQITNSNNPVNFTLSAISIQNTASGKSFHSNSEQNVMTTNLNYNGAMIIKTNSQGQAIRGYPDDDTFSLNSANLYIAGGKQVCSWSGGAPGIGHQSCEYTQDQVITAPNNVGTATVYLEGTNGYEKLFDTATVNYVSIQGYPYPGHKVVNIPWDSDIKIIVSGGIGSYNKVFHTPLTHMDYSYTCYGSTTSSPNCSTNLP